MCHILAIIFFFADIVGFFFVTCSQSRDLEENVELSAPDLLTMAKIMGSSQLVLLEGYKTVDNDRILTDLNQRNFHQLAWVSLGYPTLIKTRFLPSFLINDLRVTNQSASYIHPLKLFHNNTESFYTHIQLLTKEQRKIIAQVAQSRYGIQNLSEDQILQLIPLKSECNLQMQMDNGTLLEVRGFIQSFREHPTRLIFLAPVGSEARKLFIQNEILVEMVKISFVLFRLFKCDLLKLFIHPLTSYAIG